MCGGGGGSDDALMYQIAQEQKRKKRIASGEEQLQQLFAPLEGNAYVATKPYAEFGTEDEFLAAVREALSPKPLIPVPSTSSGRFGIINQSMPQAYRNPKANQNMLALGFSADQIKSQDAEDYLKYYRGLSGRELQEGVGTPIWEQHKQAYLDFANPQLDRQFKDASDQLTFALSRAGQTGGSVAVDRREDLETDRGQQQLNIAQTAQDYSNKARSDVEQQKQSLYQMLNSTANPGATTQAARSALAAISDKPALSPLGTLFQNTTAGLAGAVPAYRQGQAAGNVQNIIYGGDPDRGSGRVVR